MEIILVSDKNKERKKVPVLVYGIFILAFSYYKTMENYFLLQTSSSYALTKVKKIHKSAAIQS